MAEEWDYGWDYGGGTPYDDWSYGGGGYGGGAGGNMAWDPNQYTSPIGPGLLPGDPTSGGGGSWWQNVLSSLGGLSGVLGPALQAGGALAGGALGSNASSDAARLQSNALNRGLDLQTAQWLQQQANQAPWLQAGQQALPELMRLAGESDPGAFQGPPSISGQGYALPQIAPTWGPQAYRGPQYGPGSGGGGGAGGNMAPPGTPAPTPFGAMDWSGAAQKGQGGGMDPNAMQVGGNMVQDAAGNWSAAPSGIPTAFGGMDWSGAVQKGQGGGDPNAMRMHGGGGGGGMHAGAMQVGGNMAPPGAPNALGGMDWSGAGARGQGGGDPNAMMLHGGGSPGMEPGTMQAGGNMGGAGGGGGGQVPWYGDYRYTPGQVPSAAANRWTPGQGPQAQDYRYTPGQTPDAAQYASQAPNLYQGAMPGTQVSQLTGQQVLDQDPGVAFRQSEARKALEGSAAARGGLLSGSTLGGLQRQSQDLASQEYGNAFNRMMARDTEQYGRNWGQYQQHWNQGVQGAQLGLQTNAQNFGQAMSASQLREQVNQVASQQGWSQAQTEAAFREQMAQQASQQGWGQQLGETQLREQMAQQASQQGFGQALAGQGQAWQQGFAGQQWEQQQRQAYDQSVYERMMQQNQTQYGRDVAQNETDYQRQLAQYNSRQQNQNTRWNRWAGLAGVGQTAANQLGETGYATQRNLSSLLAQLGTAQGMGTLGSAGQWNQAIGGTIGGLQNLLRGLNT